MSMARRALLLLIVTAGCKGKEAETKAPPPTPATGTGSATAAGSGSATVTDSGSAAGSGSGVAAGSGSAAASDWRVVDLAVEGKQAGEFVIAGTVKVPGDAVVEFGKGRGLEDIPIDMVSIKAGDLTVNIDEEADADPKRTQLAAHLAQIKVKDADLIHKSESAGGFAIAYPQEKVVAIWGAYPGVTCGVSFDAEDATPGKTETAFKICASYVPPTK